MAGTAKPTRLPKITRAPAADLPHGHVTQRDREIVQAVYDYRALTTYQLAQLFVPPSTTRKLAIPNDFLHRLQFLYHHGYLDRLEQPALPSEGRKPFLYMLDTTGSHYIEGLRGEKPHWKKSDNTLSYPFLDHLLKTNDVRIAIVQSTKRNRCTVETWIDDKELKSPQMKDTVTVKTDAGNTSKTAIVPDGYCKLVCADRVFRSFIECDRGTMTAQASEWGRRDFRHKILAYTAYINSGMCAARYGGKAVRVLTITTTEDRLQTLKKVTEGAGGKRRFWFTTFDRIKGKDILTDYVWSVASTEAVCSFTELPPKTPA